MKNIIISDCTLRDGNHTVKHQISLDSVARYCKFCDNSGIPIVEVGHGNGLGANSLLIGRMPHTDREMLTVARDNLKQSKLGVHVIPGLATIKRDIDCAIDIGVDVFRVACHCTEATVTKSHIEYLKNKGKIVYGVLMMSALIDTNELLKQFHKMIDFGAEACIIMDSTGTYLPKEVCERIWQFKQLYNIQIGFHGHNNLGLSVANTLTAVECGADIVDATICGFGAGAGNTQLETLIPVLEKSGYSTGIDFTKVIHEADTVKEYMVKNIPTTQPIHVLTSLHKLFSGFEKPIIKAAKMYGIEYSSLIFELGNRKLVAGQENVILEVAQKMKERK